MATAETYVPWAKKDSYADLAPVPQDDAPNCLVPIAYDEMYRDCMDTFRALVKKGEKSERTLEVTQWIIRLNPGHYSVWKYRADTLLALQSSMTDELDLLDQLVKYHLKSYQVWQHRRTIVLALDDPSRELEFTAKALSIDEKNYHTWAYRQWVLCHFWADRSVAPDVLSAQSDERRQEVERVWTGELEYVEGLLDSDVRNNSAWNHRFFVAFESGNGGDEAGEREIRYVKEKLALSPNNPSAWNYLRGILARLSLPLSSLSPFVTPLALNTPSSMPPTEPPVSDKAELPAFLAIEFLADAAAQDAQEESRARDERETKAREAAELFRSLVEYDPIRREYWRFSAAQAERSVRPVVA
ncbi:hypothetical protein JCM3775_001714 [Rhodotorula graminis]|uniref:Protein farnesyltransferase/geranylgeranyltransferase type-1 subunit alpha n=1 Tax=Rhodotorula graminis (strain WP1) TaxID=578459 RepID=A0A194S482_RHOGW|nr:uncharacterized protein RHOBADRAFT_53321 [Rhodotorula graminis WP1]KPV75330.1 hypothetical protein RHOBADRAFT_53321 [Rhodotorula graminis WP1]